MTARLVSTRQVVSRGRGLCNACLTRVPAGEVYTREVIADGGDIYTWCVCRPCDAVISAYREDADVISLEEGILGEDLDDWASDMLLEDPGERRDLAVAYLERRGLNADPAAARAAFNRALDFYRDPEPGGSAR